MKLKQWQKEEEQRQARNRAFRESKRSEYYARFPLATAIDVSLHGPTVTVWHGSTWQDFKA